MNKEELNELAMRSLQNKFDPSIKRLRLRDLMNFIALRDDGENYDASSIEEIGMANYQLLKNPTISNLEFIEFLSNINKAEREDNIIKLINIDKEPIKSLAEAQLLQLRMILASTFGNNIEILNDENDEIIQSLFTSIMDRD